MKFKRDTRVSPNQKAIRMHDVIRPLSIRGQLVQLIRMSSLFEKLFFFSHERTVKDFFLIPTIISFFCQSPHTVTMKFTSAILSLVALQPAAGFVVPSSVDKATALKSSFDSSVSTMGNDVNIPTRGGGYAVSS